MQEPDESLFREYVQARMTGLRRTAYLTAVTGTWPRTRSRRPGQAVRALGPGTGELDLDAYVRRMVVRSVVDESAALASAAAGGVR